MPDTFESLLVKLTRASVEFMVVGGVAVCLNGYVRTTEDLDLLVDGSTANLRRLLDCLATFGEGFSRELTPQDFVEEGAVRIIEEFTLDVFTVMRTHPFSDFATTARVFETEGAAIRYLAPEALIELKALSTREKDQLDVAVLRRLLAGEPPNGKVDLQMLPQTPK